MSTTRFASEIAIYFRDFLETNFHKRKSPKRFFKSKNDKNLLVGINLNEFEELRTRTSKSIETTFKAEIILPKGKYTQGVNKFILELVEKYCESLKSTDVEELEGTLRNLVIEIASSNSDDVEQKKELIADIISQKTSERFFDPLLDMVGPSLKKHHNFDDDMILSVYHEVRELIHEKCRAIASSYMLENVTENKMPSFLLAPLLTVDTIKTGIRSYFDTIKSEDLFYKLNELVSNSEIIDKQEIYFYFGDIRYSGNVYPLFYIPIEVLNNGNTATIKFDSLLYINKKAIDFVVEQYNATTEKKGKIKSVSERILHLSELTEEISIKIDNILNEMINYFEMDGLFDSKSSRYQIFRSKEISISNSMYFSLFDKSDEALINDYEELIALLGSASELGNNFTELLKSFLKEEPVRVVSEVEREWEEKTVPEKLVNISPIPLNEEQNQILNSLKKDKCKYIVVEGPPGTGKSHTITAIAFNAILENKSILILSDKKEALDVVEDKITDTLNSVRLSEDFQNPILRLGKTGNTYSKILSNESLANIKLHYKAISKNEAALEQNIAKISKSIKDKITDEESYYSKINLVDIARLEELESILEKSEKLKFNPDEFISDNRESIEDFESLYQIVLDITHLLGSPDDPYCIAYEKIFSHKVSIDRTNEMYSYISLAHKVNEKRINFKDFGLIRGLTLENLDIFKDYISQLEALGKGIFGYWFKSQKIKKLYDQMSKIFDLGYYSNLKDHRDTLLRIYHSYEVLFKEFSSVPNKNSLDAQKLHKYMYDLAIFDLLELTNKSFELISDLEEVNEFIESYPDTAKLISLTKAEDMFSTKILDYSEIEFSNVIEYLQLYSEIEKNFRSIPKYDFVQNKTAIERLYTTQMTHILDKRVIDFTENMNAKAKTLKKIISAKKKFPKEEFTYLKSAFPCIIAGIRDYAEYIPLDSDLFDIVIIDEASQVSIAQALPAILRAKKIVVFGDKKQFSNIKSAQAKSEVNRQYVELVKDAYLSEGVSNASELERLSKFNIKTSVLDFFEYISNYTIMLRKHFRGYRELISYSSKFFYKNHLQAIKIRGKQINEVIEFNIIEHDGKLDKIENTNYLEIDAILKYLRALAASKNKPTIGIITPHTNQQKLLTESIFKLDLYDDLKRSHKLKIMTFDTCQGEERDIIIYSMVASPADDKLGYIFIKNLNDVDLDEDNKVKAQRLNVGFSRAKEKMVFFLSKPVDQFDGSIGDALRHYARQLAEADNMPSHDDLDPKSPMEKKVLEWLQETTFFKDYSDNIEVKAQFPVGEYLKQLNPLYKHPKYVCDFLLIYSDDSNNEFKIIIEYDGFKEHFTNIKDVNEYNYQSYYKDEDIFREKVLEGYGYKFIRINRFNLGKDPVATLDYRLRQLINNGLNNTNPSFVKNMQAIVSSLEDGNMKECLKCGKLKVLSDFKDPALTSGNGRYCRSCKSSPTKRKRDRIASAFSTGITSSPPEVISSSNCPICSAKMIARSGRYGKFLGCSRFPSCRGTRRI